MKLRIVAAILAFVFSFIGAHNFYLGRNGRGILCIIFCWTYIPTLLSLFDAIHFFSMSDAEFNQQFNQHDTSALPNHAQNLIQQTIQAQNLSIGLGQSLPKNQQNQQVQQDQPPIIEKNTCYVDRFRALSERHKKGILTDEEFLRKKQALLN